MNTDPKFFTMAPIDYDYSNTTEILRFKGGLRLVSIKEESVDYQLGRYGSGLMPGFSIDNEDNMDVLRMTNPVIID